MFNNRFWSDTSYVLLLCVAPFAGAAKCWFLALRPGVNKKCVWSLMFSLVAIYTFAFASALGPTPSTAPEVFPWIVSSLLALSAGPLAVAGLIEYSSHKGACTRGRACAICGLFVSLGIFCFFASAIVAGIMEEETKHPSHAQSTLTHGTE